MIKAIFFDIDGTLLSHADGSLLKSTRNALKALQEKGIKIFIASGRHITEIQEQPIHDIDFDGYVCLNGQLGLDKDREIIYSFPIDEHDTNCAVKHFNEKKIPIVFVEEHKLYLNFSNDYVKIAQDAIASDIPEFDTYKGNKIYQITAFASNEDLEEMLEDCKSCKMTRWNKYGVDIISNVGGKAFGIEKMMEHYNLTKEEIMAFGDGENDIDMLNLANISIAMDNAISELKEVADYVTDSSNDDGIYNALKHFELI